MAGYIATLFGCVPFVLLFVVSLMWTYRYIFVKDIVTSYALPRKVKLQEANRYIQKNFNEKYKTLFEMLALDNEMSKEAFHFNEKQDQPKREETQFKVIGYIFSLTVSFSFGLIMPMMCLLVGLFFESSRALCFKLIIICLVLLLSFIQPFAIISLYYTERFNFFRCNNYQKFSVTATCVFWLYVLHKCGDISKEFRPDSSFLGTKSLVEAKVNQISIAGITLIAILSGIGTSSTAFKFISELRSCFLKLTIPDNKFMNENQIHDCISSFNNTDMLIRKRRADLDGLIAAHSGRTYNLPSHSSDNILLQTNNIGSNYTKNKIGGFVHKVRSFATLSNLTSRKGNSEELELQNEIDSLITLKMSIFEDLIKSLDKYALAKSMLLKEGSIFGRIKKCSNCLLGIYCIYRLVDVILVRIAYRTFFATFIFELGSKDGHEDVNTEDALATTLAKMVISLTNTSMSETFLASQFSLLLTGSLFFCSLSNVSRTLHSVGKFSPSSLSISRSSKRDIQYLFVSEILGVYIMATAILIRSSLPTSLSRQFTSALSLSGGSNSNETIGQEVRFIDNWFDSIFASVCILSLLLLLVRNYLQKLDESAYDTYDEENLIEDNNVGVPEKLPKWLFSTH